MTLTAGGTIAQTAGTITADMLTGSSNGGTSFNQSGNNIATLGAFSDSGGGALSLIDNSASLDIGGQYRSAPAP